MTKAELLAAIEHMPDDAPVVVHHKAYNRKCWIEAVVETDHTMQPSLDLWTVPDMDFTEFNERRRVILIRPEIYE